MNETILEVLQRHLDHVAGHGLLPEFESRLKTEIEEIKSWSGERLDTIENHKGRCKSDAALCDWFVCSCGWESRHYWDGADFATEEWKKHVHYACREIEWPIPKK